MTDQSKTDKSGAPPCGLYLRINHNPDMDQWTPIIGALSTAVKHRSGYAKNMHVLEIALEDDFEREAMEKVAAFVQVAQMSGFVSVLKGDAQVAKDLGADGVLLTKQESIAPARALLGKDAIIGLACGDTISAMQSAVKEAADYITLGSSASPAPTTLLQQSMIEQSDIIAAMLGPFTPDNAPFYVQGGASFIDCTHYICTYEKGAMQAAVNILDVIETAITLSQSKAKSH